MEKTAAPAPIADIPAPEVLLPPAQKPAQASARNSAPATGEKLDLSRMSAPENLEEVRLEELTIDGICGVY